MIDSSPGGAGRNGEPGRSHHVRRHGALLEEADAFSNSVREFERFAGGLSVSAWLDSDALRPGQDAIRRVVSAYTDAADPGHYFADRRVFGQEAYPTAGSPVGDAIWTIFTTVLDGSEAGDFDVDEALRLAFGRDPISLTFGSALTGRLSGFVADPEGFGDFPEIPDDDRIPFETLNEIGCYIGLSDALNGVGRAAAALGQAKPYPGMTITRLQPSIGCAPEAIRVLGSGFQNKQPKDAIVVFGSTRAEVVPNTWSGTEFFVKIPNGVGECCVSVLQAPEPAAGGDTLADATLQLAGVVGDCFGQAGAALGHKLEQVANHAPGSEQAVCAPDGSNRFMGGPPRISYFRTNFGSSSPQRLPAGQPLELEWSIVNAVSASIRITPHAGTSPLATTPSLPQWFVADPVAGRTGVSTSEGLVPWTVDVELRATNACGTKSEKLELRWDPAPGLVFVGGGMRSSFDVGAIELLGLLLSANPSVCAGSGLGALSAVCAAADYPSPASLKTFWDSTSGDADWYAQLAALSTPGDFAAVNNAEWQARARAEVLTMDARGLLRNFLVPYRPADDRQLEEIIVFLAGVGADKAVDELGDAVKLALQEAGQTALSYIPIVAIVYGAAKFAYQTFNTALIQQTANLLASVPAMFDDSGLRGLITTAMTGIPGRLQASGRRLRVPMTNLEKGRVLYGLEAGGVSEAPVGSRIVANTSLQSIVTAGSAVPFLGAPTIVGSDHYVDGALGDPVPIGAAIEAGAGTVIVIQPHVRLTAEAPAFAGAGLPRIDARTSFVRDAHSLDGAVDVFSRFAVDPVTKAPVGSWRVPVFVIEPTVDLVGIGASVGQSGLTNMMSDYGYMRAYDALVPWLLFPAANQKADRDEMFADLTRSSDKVIALRVKAWQLEHLLNGWRATPFGPQTRIGSGPLVSIPQQSAIPEIRTAKSDIRAALVDRLAVPGRFEPRAAPRVPLGTITTTPIPKPRAETWVQDWEKHDFVELVAPSTVTPAKPDGDPWVSLTYAGLWTEPSATRPAMIWGP
jgi:predicted acylesterase/phospholipase RssA